jgi:hypothetical protein
MQSRILKVVNLPELNERVLPIGQSRKIAFMKIGTTGSSAEGMGRAPMRRDWIDTK